jgi:hypothetical protein
MADFPSVALDSAPIMAPGDCVAAQLNNARHPARKLTSELNATSPLGMKIRISLEICQNQFNHIL